jgi:hypothetical protein
VCSLPQRGSSDPRHSLVADMASSPVVRSHGLSKSFICCGFARHAHPRVNVQHHRACQPCTSGVSGNVVQLWPCMHAFAHLSTGCSSGRPPLGCCFEYTQHQPDLASNLLASRCTTRTATVASCADRHAVCAWECKHMQSAKQCDCSDSSEGGTQGGVGDSCRSTAGCEASVHVCVVCAVTLGVSRCCWHSREARRTPMPIAN